jgi:RNA polymerase sigma-54 factor
MSFELKITQKLTQSLTLTPQLQQAIKLLQLGRLELQEEVEKELLENPVLEDARNESEVAFSETEIFELPKNTLAEQKEELSYFESDSINWSKGSYDGEFGVESVASQQEGLISHLLWQLRAADFSPGELEIAAQIIGNLDRNGYLAINMQELASLCIAELDQVEAVLSVIQTFDPAGVAARDLRECLLLQLDYHGQVDTLAWRIVSSYMTELELRQFESIAKSEQVTREDVLIAVKEIQRLEPRPGRGFIEDAPVYITPDVYVKKIGDEVQILMNESGLPKLKLNQEYSGLMNASSKVDKSYLKEKLKSASWLIKSIEQRQQTIFKVTSSIMKFQREFLDHGQAVLKPLILRDVASDVGLHESTISRVTSNKYVHTPHGIFELKFFFGSGLKSDSGEMSSEAVKEKIKELIAGEDVLRALSDQDLAEKLTASGIHIARRTVAKYREEMKIPSSSSRRRR